MVFRNLILLFQRQHNIMFVLFSFLQTIGKILVEWINMSIGKEEATMMSFTLIPLLNNGIDSFSFLPVR